MGFSSSFAAVSVLITHNIKMGKNKNFVSIQRDSLSKVSMRDGVIAFFKTEEELSAILSERVSIWPIFSFAFERRARCFCFNASIWGSGLGRDTSFGVGTTALGFGSTFS